MAGLVSAPLSTRTACCCPSMKVEESPIPSPYDRWLQPRPNTQWQNLENQTQLEQSRFDSGPLDHDEEVSYDEDDGTASSEISDAEGIDGDSENDDTIARLLAVMESQDMRYNAIVRLRQLLKPLTLERLEEGSRLSRGSRIILEDRGFSGKTFRPYSRPMTPKQLYVALGRRVRKTCFTDFHD